MFGRSGSLGDRALQIKMVAGAGNPPDLSLFYTWHVRVNSRGGSHRYRTQLRASHSVPRSAPVAPADRIRREPCKFEVGFRHRQQAETKPT
jgi:hypothetical protein